MDEEKFLVDDTLSLISKPEPLPLIVLAVAELAKNEKYHKIILERALNDLMRIVTKTDSDKLKYQASRALVALSAFDGLYNKFENLQVFSNC